jgi:hypothetical protein
MFANALRVAATVLIRTIAFWVRSFALRNAA